MKNYTFRVIIEPDEKNTFHGFVPSLPGCHTWGYSIEETRENIKDAIKAYVFSLIDDKLPIPQDKSFEAFETFSDKELTPTKLSRVLATSNA